MGVSMSEPEPLRLRAEDTEDLEVVSACLQDAIVRVGDMAFLPKERRFVLALTRFRWEAEGAAGGRFQHFRVPCGVHFNDVLEVQIQGFDQQDHDRVLELLALTYSVDPDGYLRIVFAFAGAATLRLRCECISASLRDLGPEFKVPVKPVHRVR